MQFLKVFSKRQASKPTPIAAEQLHALREHYSGKLKLHDVKEMFLQMRDEV